MRALLRFTYKVLDRLTIQATRLSLKLMGVKFGKNLTAFFVITIAKDVSFISTNHQFRSRLIKINKHGMETKLPPIVVGDDVWIGEKAIILKSVTIGEGAVVGAGSVVTKDVPPYSIVVGNPAHVVAYRK